MKVYKKLKAKGSSLKKKMKKGHKKLKAIAKKRIDISNMGECNNNAETESVTSHCGGNYSSKEEDEDDDGNSALFFEGDCFYEAEESLIEHSDEEESLEETRGNSSSCEISLDGWVPFDEVPFDEPAPSLPEGRDANDDNPDAPEPAAAVMLEETPLPRMFIPGKIVHIYTYRGGYKPAIVPRDFRELRRISLAGSMLNDHTSKSYYEALLECKSVRKARRALPIWTGFSEEMTCSCCASRFTWASTSDSEAQEARDRHNCRACGGLVCDPCSQNRISVSHIGINVPCRVCDRCYHDMGSVLHEEVSREMSNNLGRQMDESNYDDLLQKGHLPKRNTLVDELAMRMPSASIKLR